MAREPVLAIFPWGEVIEDFLEPLGLSLDAFVEEMSGGWLFGYIAGLKAHGWRSVVVYASLAVEAPTRRVHRETGAAVWFVPGRRTPDRYYPKPLDKTLARWRRTPLRAFAGVLARERCTAVLVQDYEQPRFDALALLAAARLLPIYATFQGGDTAPESPTERWVRRRTLGHCRALIVPSAEERRRLASAYPGARLRIVDIPNPVDAETWRPMERRAARAALGLDLGLDPGAFVAVVHGRIDIRRKGLDVLLDAWKTVAAAIPEARLVIVGSGQDSVSFGPMVQAAGPSVRWISSYLTDRAEMRRLLCAADCYVSASRTEGMPVAPLEAMACGLPIVASDAQGLADIFSAPDSGGLVAPRGDAGAIAAAILKLAASGEERARLGALARERVVTRYSVEAVGQALADLLDGRMRRAAAP